MIRKHIPASAESLPRLCGMVHIRIWRDDDGRYHAALEGRGIPPSAHVTGETREEVLAWAERHIDAFLLP